MAESGKCFFLFGSFELEVAQATVPYKQAISKLQTVSRSLTTVISQPIRHVVARAAHLGPFPGQPHPAHTPHMNVNYHVPGAPELFAAFTCTAQP